KSLEQRELDAGEAQMFAAQMGLACRWIEPDVAGNERRSRICPDRTHGAAKDGANTRDELARVERLGKIGVCAERETEDAFDVFSARGEDKHAHVARCAKTPQHVEAGDTGQHEIEHDERVIARQRAFETAHTIMRAFNVEAFSLEAVNEQLA